MRRVTLAEAAVLRRTPGATAVLFLTDRCPVGCGHCSVGSRVDSPTIADWPRFAEIVAGLGELPSLRAVAITGGEPFAERRGLTHAVDRLRGAGKAVVVFTSGFWAGASVASWIGSVLRNVSTVYLSLDSFHAKGLRPAVSTARAVGTITANGCHLVLQVLDEPGAVEAARKLSPEAEINVIAPLPVGRGAGVFPAASMRPASAFGRCALLNSPTIRYDGVVIACCNEEAITGAGPAALRRQVSTRDGVGAALASFGTDPVLRVIGRYGPAALEPISPGPFRSICDSCWSAHDRAAQDPRVRAALALLGSRR
jgi:hypothetical protein